MKFYRNNKKYIFFGCFVLILFSILFVDSLLDKKTEKIIETNATPVTNKTVIIDAGHRNS